MNTLSRRQFITLTGAATAAGLLTSMDLSAASSSHFLQETAEQRRRRRFVNLELITHEGKKVHFYDDLIKDKTVLINFIYTICKNESFCPMMSLNLTKVQKLLGDRLGRDVFMYSITLDPTVDTPQQLAAYASYFKPKSGGWQFLTAASPEIIETLRTNLGFRWADKVRDQDKQQHIGMIKYGIEPLERWGTCPALSKPEAIVSYLDWMTPNKSRPVVRGL